MTHGWMFDGIRRGLILSQRIKQRAYQARQRRKKLINALREIATSKGHFTEEDLTMEAEKLSIPPEEAHTLLTELQKQGIISQQQQGKFQFNEQPP
jgi:NADH:ubiquinone oxidoreductase subunit E